MQIDPARIHCERCHDAHASKDPHFFKSNAHRAVRHEVLPGLPPCAASRGPSEGTDHGFASDDRVRVGASCSSRRHRRRAAQQNPYRLKEPDQKKLCLACHTRLRAEAEEALRAHAGEGRRVLRAATSPHVSSHGKLLSADDAARSAPAATTASIPANAKSAHKVVADGECQKCHDPHASDNAANLVAKGNDLCFGCHKELGEAIKKAKFKHTPGRAGVPHLPCPHGSDKAVRLLKTAVPGAVRELPQAGHARVRGAAHEIPGRQGRLHVLPRSARLEPAGAAAEHRASRRSAAGACNQCHEAPDSATPFATKRTGYELCKGCHNEMVNATLAKTRLHWPVADKKGCVNCHNPHASKQAKLLKADTRDALRHAATRTR